MEDKKYYVEIGFVGKYKIEVNAEDEDDAIEKAQDAFYENTVELDCEITDCFAW